MPNPLFNAIFSGFKADGNTPSQVIPSASKTPITPSNAPKMTMMDAMSKLRSDPAQMIRQAGYNVPDEIAGNPQAAVMHLLQTGQVGGAAMQRIQPMLNMLMGRR